MDAYTFSILFFAENFYLVLWKFHDFNWIRLENVIKLITYSAVMKEMNSMNQI